MIRPYRQTSQSPTCPSGARIGRTGRKALWYWLHWLNWSEMWNSECRAAVYRVLDPWGRCWGWSQRCTGCTWHRIVGLSAVCPCQSVEIVGWIDGRVHWALPWDRFRQNHRCRWSPAWSGCTVGTWRDCVCVLRSCWLFQVLLGLQGHKDSLGYGSLGHHVADAMHAESVGNVEVSKRDVLQGVAGRGTGRCQGAFQGKCVLGIVQRMIGDEVGLGCGFDHHFAVVSSVTDEGLVAVERVESNVDFHLRREELVRVESQNLSQRPVEGLVPQVARGTASFVRGGENFSMGKVGITASIGPWLNGHVALQDTPGFLVVIGHVEKDPEPLYHGKQLGCGIFVPWFQCVKRRKMPCFEPCPS